MILRDRIEGTTKIEAPTCAQKQRARKGEAEQDRKEANRMGQNETNNKIGTSGAGLEENEDGNIDEHGRVGGGGDGDEKQNGDRRNEGRHQILIN